MKTQNLKALTAFSAIAGEAFLMEDAGRKRNRSKQSRSGARLIEKGCGRK